MGFFPQDKLHTFTQQNSVLCTWRIHVFIDFIQFQFFSLGSVLGKSQKWIEWEADKCKQSVVKRPSYCSFVSVFSDYKSHEVDKPSQQRRVCPGKWEAIALLSCSVLFCILAEKWF